MHSLEVGVLGVLLGLVSLCPAVPGPVHCGLFVAWKSLMWRSSKLKRTLESTAYLFISQTISELPWVYGGFTGGQMGSLPWRKLTGE